MNQIERNSRSQWIDDVHSDFSAQNEEEAARETLALREQLQQVKVGRPHRHVETNETRQLVHSSGAWEELKKKSFRRKDNTDGALSDTRHPIPSVSNRWSNPRSEVEKLIAHGLGLSIAFLLKV